MKKAYAVIAIVIAMLSFFSLTVFAQYEGLAPGEHYDSDLVTNDQPQAPSQVDDTPAPPPSRSIASVPQVPPAQRFIQKRRSHEGDFEEVDPSSNEGDFKRVRH